MPIARQGIIACNQRDNRVGESFSVKLAGCGKTFLARQTFGGLHVLDKKRTLRQDAQKGRPVIRET